MTRTVHLTSPERFRDFARGYPSAHLDGFLDGDRVDIDALEAAAQDPAFLRTGEVPGLRIDPAMRPPKGGVRE